VARAIVILEDNAERRAVMRACIADRFYTFDAHFFDEAAEMIRYLDGNLSDALVIALDNDLDMKPGADGRAVDVGEGRHVAESSRPAPRSALASFTPATPTRPFR